MTGASPLLYAVMHGSVECTRLLLDAGANVNHKNKDGITPLHRAAEYERPDCATLLLEKGADINIMTDE